jgi:hypothetical protein
MTRWVWALGLGVLLLMGPVSSAALEEEEGLDGFFPLVTRRPVLERVVGFLTTYEEGHRGREVRIAPVLAVPILSWWQVQLEMPAVLRDPRHGEVVAGAGDLHLENLFVLYRSKESDTLLSGGVGLTLPTGSGRRALGGETAIEPFLTAGTLRGHFYLIAEVAYAWTLDAPGPRPRQQVFTASGAMGYRVRSWLIPFLELTSVTKVRGAEEVGAQDRRGRTQVYLTPGVNIQILPRATLGLGVQLPVTNARAFDYRLHASLDWTF